jgi:glutathione S-transferase
LARGMTMETALEIPPDTAAVQQADTAVQQANGTVAVVSLETRGDAARTTRKNKSRQGRTRQGKHRLLTIGDLDCRTAAAQAARKLVETLSTSLGGDDQLTAQQHQLVMRAALVGAIAADLETRWIAGESVPLADYWAACNVQRRLLATLGIERETKDVTDAAGKRFGQLLREGAIRQQAEDAAKSAAKREAFEHQQREKAAT